ncbi:hypothetical protein WJX77_002708 [Trebouxia sp. C0004]
MLFISLLSSLTSFAPLLHPQDTPVLTKPLVSWMQTVSIKSSCRLLYAALDVGRDDDWYDKLQPLESSDSEFSHYSTGDDSPLSRLADSGCDLNLALDAAFPATPPTHQINSRVQALIAVEKVQEVM